MISCSKYGLQIPRNNNGDRALVLAYDITDSGALDDDMSVDGTILDPVGLAVPDISAATLADTGEER